MKLLLLVCGYIHLPVLLVNWYLFLYPNSLHQQIIYKQVIGIEPKNLVDPKNIEKLFPKSLDEAIDYAKDHSYELQAARHN